MRDMSVSGEIRSACMVVILEACLGEDVFGMITSVNMRLAVVFALGSVAASSWPRKPPTPVMRMVFSSFIDPISILGSYLNVGESLYKQKLLTLHIIVYTLSVYPLMPKKASRKIRVCN